MLLRLAVHVVKRSTRVLVPASVKLCNLPSEALCHEAPDKPSARRSACACQTSNQTIARDQSQAGKQPEIRVRLSVRSAGSLLRPGAVAIIGQPHRNPNHANKEEENRASRRLDSPAHTLCSIRKSSVHDRRSRGLDWRSIWRCFCWPEQSLQSKQEGQMRSRQALHQEPCEGPMASPLSAKTGVCQHSSASSIVG